MSPAAVIRSALLDRYAVDLMPFDTVRSLFERDPCRCRSRDRAGDPDPGSGSAGAAPAGADARPLAPPAVPGGGAPAGGSPQPATDPPSRPSLGRRVARGIGQVVTFILQAAFFLLMCAWGIGSCVMTVLPSDAATSPPPVVVPEPEVTDPSTLAVVRQPPDRDAPVLADIEVGLRPPAWRRGWSWSRARGRGTLLGSGDVTTRSFVHGRRHSDDAQVELLDLLASRSTVRWTWCGTLLPPTRSRASDEQVRA